MKLTERQGQIVAFIQEFWADNEFGPSVRDIGSHFGITMNGVVHHLDALERRGAIRRGRLSGGQCAPRAIRVLTSVEQ